MSDFNFAIEAQLNGAFLLTLEFRSQPDPSIPTRLLYTKRKNQPFYG